MGPKDLEFGLLGERLGHSCPANWQRQHPSPPPGRDSLRR